MTGSRAINGWSSSPEYQSSDLQVTTPKFLEITNLLLERPNLNSTYLFRADIISDSAALLKTVIEKELEYQNHGEEVGSTRSMPGRLEVESNDQLPATTVLSNDSEDSTPDVSKAAWEPFVITGFDLTRTVVRTLIPRKPQVDRALTQSCFIYVANDKRDERTALIVVYAPHAESESNIPWYHPQVKALAYRYDYDGQVGTLGVHFKRFSESQDPIPSRLHRTFISLLQTFVRLCKLDSPMTASNSERKMQASARLVTPAALKDTILPQHVVQDTYTKLKQTYASDLISKWVEATDPAKHVFEDIAIAAFLVEMWKTMYSKDEFPGFMDIACGNGVLVYILIQEGYNGHGFDARRRKTWDALDMNDHLSQMLCIPKPFLNVLTSKELDDNLSGVTIHDGTFDKGTFIISNHADELTAWTPILAALSNTEKHLPFISIPCCSHALDGRKHRYSFKDIDAAAPDLKQNKTATDANETNEEDQPTTGDLKALRAQKAKALSHNDDNSMYACLTKKTAALAEELGSEVELTLLRIPSTRNIGIVGNRHQKAVVEVENGTQRLPNLLERECGMTGGVKESALGWVSKAKKHVGAQGRGKVNLGRRPAPSIDDHIDSNPIGEK